LNRTRLLFALAAALFAVWLSFEVRGREPEYRAPGAVGSNEGGQAAPDIGIMTAKGELRLSQLKGKVVIVDFWGTWCGPCRMSIPALVSLYKKYQAEGLEIMGVALENDNGGQIPRFVEELGITYPVGMPLKREEVQAYDAASLPTFVAVDRKGNIRFGQKGWSDTIEGKLQVRIKELLDER
jgi:thiol-disulfide isomerase/thioredoxin